MKCTDSIAISSCVTKPSMLGIMLLPFTNSWIKSTDGTGAVKYKTTVYSIDLVTTFTDGKRMFTVGNIS